jgi:hypothetical protein
MVSFFTAINLIIRDHIQVNTFSAPKKSLLPTNVAITSHICSDKKKAVRCYFLKGLDYLFII